jgi:N-acetylglutamate synthase-like GNAT family acetyltransferase
MSIEIRRATIHDIDAMAEIIMLAFDDVIDTERVRRLLTLSHNYVYVAVKSDVVVGFVENFVTISQDDQVRLELDLLAVHPDARGQGIGKKLIEASINLARRLDVYCLRALIASENGVMQKACQRMNLVPSQDIFGLYVKSAEQLVNSITEIPTSHLIRVETLTYKGIWLEGDISATVIDNAHRSAIENRCDILGAVMNSRDSHTIDLLAERQFTHINDYRRWTLNLKSD